MAEKRKRNEDGGISDLDAHSHTLFDIQKLNSKKDREAKRFRAMAQEHHSMVTTKKPTDEVKEERLVYDRLPRSDTNGMKKTLLFNVWEQKFHIEGSKCHNFNSLARIFETLKIQGMTRISGLSLQKKYDSLISQVRDSVSKGYIPAIEGAGSDNDEGFDSCDTSDSEANVHRRKFSGVEPFERIALSLIKEIDAAEETKKIKKTEKTAKNNELGTAETIILDGIHGTSSNGTSSNGTSSNGTSSNGTSSNGTSSNGTSSNGTSSNGTSSNGTSSSSTSKNPKLRKADSTDMDELKVLLTAVCSPAPPTLQSNSLSAADSATIIRSTTAKLSSLNVKTVGDALRHAGVSPQGLTDFTLKTGMPLERPVQKLAFLYQSLAEDKSGTLVKNVQATCGLNPSDSVDLVEMMTML